MSQQINSSTSTVYAYRLCGWHTVSDLPLTALPVSRHGGEIDVHIRFASGDSPIAKVEDWLDSAECTLLRAKNVADFEVTGGRQIRVWPVADVSPKDIEIALFGPVWGVLCHQRGVLPLHASAIVTGNGITAFAGYSGVGKSTTAALMASQGYELVADDILPISFDRTSLPGAWPYLRRLKLQSDVITHLALMPAAPVGETLDQERYFVGPQRIADDKWRKLEQIFFLETDAGASRVTVDQITATQAVRDLIDQTYRLDFILETDQIADHFASCAKLASKIDFYRVRRGRSLSAAKEFTSVLCAHLKEASR